MAVRWTHMFKLDPPSDQTLMYSWMFSLLIRRLTQAVRKLHLNWSLCINPVIFASHTVNSGELWLYCTLSCGESSRCTAVDIITISVTRYDYIGFPQWPAGVTATKIHCIQDGWRAAGEEDEGRSMLPFLLHYQTISGKKENTQHV